MNLFKDLGQLAGVMRHLPKFKEHMERLQQRLAQVTADGDAGGGMVKIRVNGKMEVVSCSLSEEALRLGDRELLEDLVAAAANQALSRVRLQVAEETGKMASELGLPPGLGLPGPGFPAS
jgi:nucleoid-associated protein EbfC